MLISHKHKFITIDIPKTGTRSMRETLELLKLFDFHGGPKVGEIRLWQHSTALEAKIEFARLGWDWDSYFKYVVVRNPYDRYLSFLNYLNYFSENLDSGKFTTEPQLNQARQARSLFDNSKDVEEVMCKLITRNQDHWRSQDCFFRDDSGNVIVDYIGDFDNINEAFSFFCNKTSIGENINLKHSNKSNKTFKKEQVFSKRNLELLSKKEEFVINLMGYKYK